MSFSRPCACLSPPRSVVDRARCGAHTGPNEGTLLGVSCPGANRCPTARANRCTGECAAPCCHHRQHGQSRQETHDACCSHGVFLPPVRLLLLMPLLSGASPESVACARSCSAVDASVMPWQRCASMGHHVRTLREVQSLYV